MSTDKLMIKDGELHFRVGRSLVPVPAELKDELENSASDFFSEALMQPPSRTDLPFFAYGLFKPGQLGFASLRPHLQRVDAQESMEGTLYERDGVPLFVEATGGYSGEVKGALIAFSPEGTSKAYEAIANIEPERQYKWGILKTKSGITANVLVAKSTDGANHIEENDWDGRKDPHFSEALELVEAIASASSFEFGTVKRLMELQMAYMLLWTSIERYTSLRYHLRKKVMAKIRPITNEPGFREALAKYVEEEREVYSTDAGKAVRLSPNNPKGSLSYYYQVRSNIAHRGKALMVDSDMLLNCIKELLPIFRETKDRGFEECELTYAGKSES
jgi:hypothetical protein